MAQAGDHGLWLPLGYDQGREIGGGLHGSAGQDGHQGDHGGSQLAEVINTAKTLFQTSNLCLVF